MIAVTYRSGLEWPRAQARHAKRCPSRYRVSLQDALIEMQNTLRRMSCRSVVVTADVELTLSGQLRRVSQRAGADPGVAIYFDWGDDRRCFACDAWDSLAGNVRAVGVTLEALRTIGRAGASQMMQQAFSGFAALPASTQMTQEADAYEWEAYRHLGLEMGCGTDAVNQAYRRLAKVEHPDSRRLFKQFYLAARVSKYCLYE